MSALPHQKLAVCGCRGAAPAAHKQLSLPSLFPTSAFSQSLRLSLLAVVGVIWLALPGAWQAAEPAAGARGLIPPDISAPHLSEEKTCTTELTELTGEGAPPAVAPCSQGQASKDVPESTHKGDLLRILNTEQKIG